MNKSNFLLTILLLLSAAWFLSSYTLAADKLQTLIDQCEACHGPGGQSERNDVPSIAGMPMSKFKESMAQFYYFERHCPGKRPRTEEGTGSSTTMCSIASTLSDEEVQMLAQVYKSQ